jgi:hypothetical protein
LTLHFTRDLHEDLTHCAVRRCRDGLAVYAADSRRAPEGDGWVNWSGLATMLSGIGHAFANPLRRLEAIRT